MRDQTAKKGQNTTLFDEPEGAYLWEDDVIKKYNKELEKNPEYPLPEVSKFFIII